MNDLKTIAELWRQDPLHLSEHPTLDDSDDKQSRIWWTMYTTCGWGHRTEIYNWQGSCPPSKGLVCYEPHWWHRSCWACEGQPPTGLFVLKNTLRGLIDRLGFLNLEMLDVAVSLDVLPTKLLTVAVSWSSDGVAARMVSSPQLVRTWMMKLYCSTVFTNLFTFKHSWRGDLLVMVVPLG